MKYLLGLLSLCALAVHAETKTLDDLGVEAQQRSQWCWAAVSVMGIRSFPEQGDFRHLTQLEVVARRRAGAETLAQAAVKKDKIATQQSACEPQGKCNSGRPPLLFDISSDFPAPGQALSMAAFATDIRDQKHPVIIRWVYGANPNGDQQAGFVGAHALIITGYNTDADEVRVFDPLPVGSTDLSEHEFWIPYDTYVNPASDEGVTAMHGRDQYRMRRVGTSAPPESKYPLKDAPDPAVDAPDPGGFPSQCVLDTPITDYMSKRVFRDSAGRPREGKLTAGKPIPIVALRARELMQTAARPEQLLAQRTAAYVVPVMHGKCVVDSFLVLKQHGMWKQGGYSNKRIASLLAKIRDELLEQGSTAPDAQDVYLVSIPELGEFFVGHGFKEKARLRSLAHDGLGEFQPANKALGDVIQESRAAAADQGKPETKPVTAQ